MTVRRLLEQRWLEEMNPGHTSNPFKEGKLKVVLMITSNLKEARRYSNLQADRPLVNRNG